MENSPPFSEGPKKAQEGHYSARKGQMKVQRVQMTPIYASIGVKGLKVEVTTSEYDINITV